MTPADRAMLSAMIRGQRADGPAVAAYADGDSRLATAPKPPQGPAVATPKRVGMFDQFFNGTGIPERVNALNSLLNPVVALGEAGQHSRNMLAPGRAPMQRVSDAGQMLSGMAGTVAPMWAASKGAVPTTNAIVDALTGINMGGAPEFLADEFGGVKLDFRGDYAGTHTAPKLERGATLDNPADIWGDDIYSSNAMRYFGTGDDKLDRESFGAILAARQNPDADVMIYRAVPMDAPDDINAGDWVTTSARYARDHGESALGGDYRIVTEQVKAGELATDGNSPHEWGWWPSEARKAAAKPPGITAYHGSPYSFDKFSMDKIGTGEGAQAYGHGLYFADSEDVARSYRNALAPGEDPRQGVKFRGAEMPDANPTNAREQLVIYMRQGGYTPEDAFERARKTFTPEMMREIDGLSPEDFSVFAQDKYNGPGSMYEVRINANPETFLDWDKPLSEQPQAVRDAVGRAGYKSADRSKIAPPKPVRGGFEVVDASGKAMVYKDSNVAQQAYEIMLDQTDGGFTVQRRLGGGAKATQTLREAGIPGIKYLDAGSRGAGDGSRNYVVFDENLIEIVKKYGIAGAAAVLGMNAADVEAAVSGKPAPNRNKAAISNMVRAQ